MSKGYNIDENNHAFVTTDSPAVAEFFKEKHPKIGVNYVGEGEDLSTEDFLSNANSYVNNYLDGYSNGAIIGFLKGLTIAVGCSFGVAFIGLKAKDFIAKKLEEKERLDVVKEDIIEMISNNCSNTIITKRIIDDYPEMDREKVVELVVKLRNKINGD